MLNRHPFTKLGSSLRGLLTLAQLDEQGFIRMDTDAASLRSRRALGFQRALRAGDFGKMNDAARPKGHFLLGRAADDLLFTIQGKSLFVKVFAHPNWPGFAIDFQIIGALTHQMATQIGPINVQFLQTSSLPLQIFADRFGDLRLWDIGWRDAHRADQTAIQIMKHMPLVSIYSHTATFASVAHLGVFHTDAPVLGNPLDEAHLSLFAHLYILLL